jgi:hypothetical protein
MRLLLVHQLRACLLPALSPTAAEAFKQHNVTEAGAVAAAAACLATFGCSLRFGLVLLTVSYSSCKLRQFKEARVVQDFSAIKSPLVAQQQQEQQQQPRDWLEVGASILLCHSAAGVNGPTVGTHDHPAFEHQPATATEVLALSNILCMHTDA